MRSSKKEHYRNLLEDNKNNIKNTWKVLNDIIKKRKNKNGYPNYFITKNNLTSNDTTEIVNEFNEFFVGVGPGLAGVIANTGNMNEVESTTMNVSETMFLKGTNDREIIGIVHNLKSKKSTDYNDFDMSLVKDIIECVMKPLTYICNQSPKTGVFPTKMKAAKVIPIFKSGNSHILSNYRPVSLLSQFSKILEKLFYTRLDDFNHKA